MYIERAVPAADIHTVKDSCKLRTCRWGNSVSAQATAENLYMYDLLYSILPTIYQSMHVHTLRI